MWGHEPWEDFGWMRRMSFFVKWEEDRHEGGSRKELACLF